MKLREVILCGLFIALITVGTFVRIPVGTDVYTLQFLFTLLAGLMLGARLGALAIGTYVLMGLVGIPVFASGGGPAYVLQPTFGYLVGFILQGWVTGALVRRGVPTFRRALAACAAGMVVLYALGIPYFYFISNYIIDAPIGFWVAVWYCGVLQVLRGSGFMRRRRCSRGARLPCRGRRCMQIAWMPDGRPIIHG